MTVRTDITVDFQLDPRLADIGAGSADITVQDSHDTLVEIEDGGEAHGFPFLVSTAGGEDLGGGTTVGLTTTLQNLQYAFEATSPRCKGAATTTDALGVTLTDTGATFISDGALRGDWIINFTDQSVTEILTVDSETQLTTRGLRNGTANTFTVSDSYKVWEAEVAELTGGNFVAIDEFGADINPLFSSFGRFISKASASSATSSSQADLEYASFGGVVSVDSINGNDDNKGNKEYPVKTITRAAVVANSRGFDTLYMVESVTFTTGDDVTGFTLLGRHQSQVIMTFESDAIVDNVQIRNCTIEGTIDNAGIINNCLIADLDHVNGIISGCTLFAGTITLGGNKQTTFNNCISNVAGNATPYIDLGGSGQPLVMRNYTGGIALQNRTGSDAISIDLVSGQILLEATFGGGSDIRLAGAGRIKNLGTATIDDSGMISGTVSIASQGFVVVDLASSNTGIVYPVGTIPYPVNNFNDAMGLADKHNVYTMKGVGELTLDQAITANHLRFIGISPSQSQVHMGSFVTWNELTCEDMAIDGTCSGLIDCYRCVIDGLLNFVGNTWNCTYSNGSTHSFGTGFSVLYSPAFIANETDPIVFDKTPAGSGLAIENGQGAVKITNKTADDTLYIHMAGGVVILDSTVTAGDIRLYGTGKLVDNSVWATVQNDMVGSDVIKSIATDVTYLRDIEGGKWELVGNQMIFYAADNTTEVSRFNMFDSDGNATTTGDIYKRERV